MLGGEDVRDAGVEVGRSVAEEEDVEEAEEVEELSVVVSAVLPLGVVPLT